MIRGEVNVDIEPIIPLELHGPDGQAEELDAAIDTGFSGPLAVTPTVAARLGLPFLMTRAYELGDGKVVEFDVHRVVVVWDGREIATEALVTDGGALVGMSLIRGYRLSIDAIDGGDVLIEARA